MAIGKDLKIINRLLFSHQPILIGHNTYFHRTSAENGKSPGPTLDPGSAGSKVQTPILS